MRVRELITSVGVLIVLLRTASFGQTINEGIIQANNKTSNVLSIEMVNIDTLFQMLENDFGQGKENKKGEIIWSQIEKAEWATYKISIRLTQVREGSKTIALIRCTSQRGKDLLAPNTASQRKVREYFEEKLKE